MTVQRLRELILREVREDYTPAQYAIMKRLVKLRDSERVKLQKMDVEKLRKILPIVTCVQEVAGVGNWSTPTDGFIDDAANLFGRAKDVKNFTIKYDIVAGRDREQWIDDHLVVTRDELSQAAQCKDWTDLSHTCPELAKRVVDGIVKWSWEVKPNVDIDTSWI